MNCIEEARVVDTYEQNYHIPKMHDIDPEVLAYDSGDTVWCDEFYAGLSEDDANE